MKRRGPSARPSWPYARMTPSWAPRAACAASKLASALRPRFRVRHPSYREDFFSHRDVRPMGAGRDLYGLRADGAEFSIEIGLIR